MTDAEERHGPPPYWNAATRVLFRFFFLYFSLYCLGTQILTSLITLPDGEIPDLATLWPVRLIPQWAATHVFGVAAPLAYQDTGSGDRMFDWILAFCILVIAAIGAGVWTAVDRTSLSYPRLDTWFRIVLRICLAGQMFVYGMTKAVPLQMPFPYLAKLVQPYGTFSPMGVLWASIGVAPAYETFAGCAELLAGVLLVVPRTALLGAVVCLMDMIQVFALNMAYDVPVKLFSLHLIVMAVFLIAPEAPRLARFFFSDKAVEPSRLAQPFATRRANRVAAAVQVVIGIVLLGINVAGVRSAWKTFGPGKPKSAMYGIWDVEEFSIDGQARAAVITDNERWRRAIFDFPSSMAFQRMDATLARYRTAIDTQAKTLALTKGDDPKWKASFSFERPAPDQMTLDGEMDGHATRMRLRLVDHTKFLLLSREFHWIQEGPFNR